jgi:hypothetical protein
MTTTDLIDRLVYDLKPVPRGAVPRRLAIGIGAGVAVSAVAMLLWLGPRPDLAAAAQTAPFWVKFFYTLLAGIAGFWAVERLGRPAVAARGAAIAGLVILLAIALLAAVQLAVTARDLWPSLIFGGSATVCPWRIIALALPAYLGSLWAMRGLAPTRLTLAGLASGLVAGGVGAFVYSFACIESAAPFVAIWYSLGILVSGLVGALLGRIVLRW